MFPDSFTLQLAMGGQRAECIAPKTLIPQRGWRACVPFRVWEQLQANHLSLRARSGL